MNNLTPGPRSQVMPSVLEVVGQCSSICWADTEPGCPHSVSYTELRRVVLQLVGNTCSPHLLNQIKKVHIPDPRLFKNLHLHLANDPSIVPNVNVPIGELRRPQTQLLDVMDTPRSLLLEELVDAKAADEGIAAKCDGYRLVHTRSIGLIARRPCRMRGAPGVRVHRHVDANQVGRIGCGHRRWSPDVFGLRWRAERRCDHLIFGQQRTRC